MNTLNLSVAALTAADHHWLQRCMTLAEQALASGNEPFGTVLVDGEGQLRFEDHNRVSGGDATRHPELTAVEWAVAHLNPQARAAATVYTSGEHCPMCAAAHAWVGLGRIVFASSSTQLGQWLREWGAPALPVNCLPIREIAPQLPLTGPVPAYEAAMKALYARAFQAT